MKVTVKQSHVICSNPTNPYHAYFAWPTVARLQDGRLAMVASGFRRRHICPFGKVVICFSDDEGQTWTRPTVVMDTPLDDRDAGILPFGENSVLITSFNNTKEFQKACNTVRHTPDAKEWADPYTGGYLEILDGEDAEARYLGSTLIISHDGAKTFGEIKRIPVTCPHGPVLMNDGSILYVGRYFDTKHPHCHNMLAAYKVFADGSFEKLGEIPDIPHRESHEPHAVVLDDGKILVHIRVQGGGFFTIYQSESTDGGVTFTQPHQLLEDCGGAPAHLLKLKNGTLISTYGYRSIPYGIKAMISRDGGATWDTGHTLYTDAPSGDLGYPASVELENRDILTVFYAREEQEGPASIMQTVWHLDEN